MFRFCVCFWVLFMCGTVAEANNWPTTVFFLLNKGERRSFHTSVFSKAIDFFRQLLCLSFISIALTVWRWLLTYEGSHVPILNAHNFLHNTVVVPRQSLTWLSLSMHLLHHTNYPKNDHIFMGIIWDTSQWWHYTKIVCLKITFGAKCFQAILILNWDKS